MSSSNLSPNDAGPLALLHRIARARALARQGERQRAELNALDATMLRDLAICRSEIESCVAEAQRKAPPTRLRIAVEEALRRRANASAMDGKTLRPAFQWAWLVGVVVAALSVCWAPSDLEAPSVSRAPTPSAPTDEDLVDLPIRNSAAASQGTTEEAPAQF